MQHLGSGSYPKTHRNDPVKIGFEDYEILDVDFEEVSDNSLAAAVFSTGLSAIGWTLVGACKVFEFALPLLAKASLFIFVHFCKGIHLCLSAAWSEWVKECPSEADINGFNSSVHVETNVHSSGGNVHVETNVFVNK